MSDHTGRPNYAGRRRFLKGAAVVREAAILPETIGSREAYAA